MKRKFCNQINQKVKVTNQSAFGHPSGFGDRSDLPSFQQMHFERQRQKRVIGYKLEPIAYFF